MTAKLHSPASVHRPPGRPSAARRASVREAIVQHDQCLTRDVASDISPQCGCCGQYRGVRSLQQPEDVETILVVEPPLISLGNAFSDPRQS